MLRILIADDHNIVREGLKQILADMPQEIDTDEAKTGDEVLEKVSKKKYDMLLLDFSMPGKSGLEVLKQLKKEQPHLPTMILSSHPEEQYAIGALKAGASAYLTKESTPEELITAIQKVSRGEQYVTSSMAMKLNWDQGKNEDSSDAQSSMEEGLG